MIAGNVDELNRNVSGWAIHTNGHSEIASVDIYVDDVLYITAPCDEPRPDVLEKHGVLQCGFNLSIEDALGENSKLVSIYLAGTKILLPNGQGHVHLQSLVLRGEEGFLFLINDSNNALKQVSGEICFSDLDANAFARMQLCRHYLVHGLGGKYACYILPEKSIACSAYLPKDYTISNKRSALQAIDAARFLECADVEYLHKLARPPNYYKTDNHMNSTGNYALLTEITERHGLSIQHFKSRIAIAEERIVGDLGAKLSPIADETAELFTIKDSEIEVVIDEVSLAIQSKGRLTGTVARWRNNKAESGSRIYLFGTSSAFRSCYFIANYFQETCFVWSNSIDVRSLREFAPDLVVHLLTERFIKAEFADYNFSISSFRQRL